MTVGIVADAGAPHKLNRFRHKHGCEVLDTRRLASRGPDWWSAWSQFWF